MSPPAANGGDRTSILAYVYSFYWFRNHASNYIRFITIERLAKERIVVRFLDQIENRSRVGGPLEIDRIRFINGNINQVNKTLIREISDPDLRTIALPD